VRQAMDVNRVARKETAVKAESGSMET